MPRIMARALVARLLFEIFIAKALYHCEIIMADDIVLFAVIHSHGGSIQPISAGLRIFPKGIRAQLDFWLENWNNTNGYPEISDLNRWEALPRIQEDVPRHGGE